MDTLKQKLPDYLSLIRFDRPIGTYLLLWPTLWALWLAAEGIPDLSLLVIFFLGTFLTRSAGCVINDFADRNFDGQVKRTATRPMATGRVSVKEAMLLCAALLLTAFILVLFTNFLTIMLSFVAVALTACYPFLKRYTHLPQLVLGMAFSWGIPMAFAAQTGELPKQLWLIYIGALLWTVVYDTQYAMVDRDDDIKLGLKSTAILFADDDKRIIGLLQICMLFVMLLVGLQFELSLWYYLGLFITSGLFIVQQRLIKDRDRDNCFKAFLNNNYVGMTIFISIVLHFSLPQLFST